MGVTYCGVCACSCIHPRTILNPPKTSYGLLGSDILDGDPSDSGMISTNWLQEWHILQVGIGIVPNSSDEDHDHLTILTRLDSDTPEQSPVPRLKNHRTTPIHHYCLQAVLNTISTATFHVGYSHEESLMLNFSLPRVIGNGPWEFDSFYKRIGPLATPGYWCGASSQINRFLDGVEGSHLNPGDLASPLILGKIRSQVQSSLKPRPTQSSSLIRLPSAIHTQILICLLDLWYPSSDVALSAPQLLDPFNIQSMLAITRTCGHFRDPLILPSSVWRILTLDSVHRYKLEVLKRWRANPTGVGSASRLSEALDEAFGDVIDRALESVQRSITYPYQDWSVGVTDGGGLEVRDVMMKDVFQWWMYDAGWRSRRRVWYCVVHACATARDADWW